VNAINFWIFETFCEDAPCNKLCGSINFVFLDLQIKSYGFLKFLGEVWAAKNNNSFNFLGLDFFSKILNKVLNHTIFSKVFCKDVVDLSTFL
jgi:hypothetical protein